MDRYLVSVPHGSDHSVCIKVVRTFLRTGSHYLTHADWGCLDGDHTAWMVVEGNSREEVAQIVPPPLRSDAKVVQLTKFSMEEIDELDRRHREEINS